MAHYRELHRPQFHFTASEHWINDPNGLVYQDGVWHLFFQHNPQETVWGNMTWGHAVSNDLLHWRQVEHALYPDEHGTMFSGSAVVDHDNTAGFGSGTLLAFYTAAGSYVRPERPFTQCLAYSVDNGSTWTKYAANPVVPWLEDGNRDPKVIWHEPSRHWIMALYLAGDRYCLLRSKDARTWERFQDLTLTGDRECPDFFPLTDAAGVERWIFWGANGYYRIGSFDGASFTAETELQICEHGPNGYAAQTWSNVPDGRSIQISWMAGGLYPEMPFNQQMSIPVELSLAGSGIDVALVRRPVREIEALYQRRAGIERQAVNTGQPLIADTEAKLLDVSFTVQRQQAKALYISIRGQLMQFDWSRAEVLFRPISVNKAVRDRAPAPLPAGEEFQIRLLIDTTSIELFVNEGRMSASYCFLPDAHVHCLAIHSYDGEQTITNLEVCELVSVWE
jgi:fructan beta-fructosidase